MAEKDLYLSTCEYKPEGIKIMIDKEIIEVEPRLMSGFNIIKDFDHSFFPVIQITLSLNRVQYDQIVKNRTKVKIQLKMRRIVRTNNSDKKEDFINKAFTIYVEDARPFLEQSEYDTQRKSNNSTSADGSDDSKQGDELFQFYLFDDALIRKTKTLINQIFTDTNMTNVIAASLSSAGFDKLLMEKLDNKETYEEVIIPPLDMIDLIQYLDSAFGLYKEQHLLFFDTNLNYLVSRSPSVKAYQKNEIHKVVMTVRKISSGEGMNGGYIIDKDNGKYLIDVDARTFNASNPTITNNSVDGNGRMLMNPYKDKLKKIVPETIQRGKANMKYMTWKYPTNTLLLSQIESELEENSLIISISLTGVDIDILAPNKNITLKFEDSKIQKEYGGKYRVRQIVMGSSRRDDTFLPTFQLELVK